MKCIRETDQHTRTAQAGQTKGTQSWDNNHSAAGPNGAGMSKEVEGSTMMEMVPNVDEVTTPPETYSKQDHLAGGKEGEGEGDRTANQATAGGKPDLMRRLA